MLTDPIADMFTKIRNANLRCKRTVEFPFSKFKLSICEKLKQNNYLTQFWVDEKRKKIKAEIKYFNRTSSIYEIKRISKPSQQIYFKLFQIKKNCLDKGTYLFSTSQGLLTHKEALERKLGGKLIGFVS